MLYPDPWALRVSNHLWDWGWWPHFLPPPVLLLPNYGGGLRGLEVVALPLHACFPDLAPSDFPPFLSYVPLSRLTLSLPSVDLSSCRLSKYRSGKNWACLHWLRTVSRWWRACVLPPRPLTLSTWGSLSWHHHPPNCEAAVVLEGYGLKQTVVLWH